MAKQKEKKEVTDIQVVCKVLSDKGICSVYEFDRAKKALEEG